MSSLMINKNLEQPNHATGFAAGALDGVCSAFGYGGKCFKNFSLIVTNEVSMGARKAFMGMTLLSVALTGVATLLTASQAEDKTAVIGVFLGGAIATTIFMAGTLTSQKVAQTAANKLNPPKQH